MLKTGLTVIALCLLSFNSYAAKIYKWIGPDGQVHYSSTPPPEVDAQSTGLETSKSKPEKPAEDKDDDNLTDEERIKRLEQKIKELEEKDTASGKSDNKDESPEEQDGEKSEEEAAKENKQPDYSVQGQIKMLEQAQQREQMMVRCRAKAPHGTDCNKAANYEKY